MGPALPGCPVWVGEDSWVPSVPGWCRERDRWVIMEPWSSFQEKESRGMPPGVLSRGKR